MPMRAILVNVNRKGQSIVVVSASAKKNPINDCTETMTSEVPMAFLMSIFERKINDGIIKNPPPAPIIPVRMPIKAPSKIINELLYFDSIDLEFFTMDMGAFSMANAAGIITKANNPNIPIRRVTKTPFSTNNSLGIIGMRHVRTRETLKRAGMPKTNAILKSTFPF